MAFGKWETFPTSSVYPAQASFALRVGADTITNTDADT